MGRVTGPTPDRITLRPSLRNIRFRRPGLAAGAVALAPLAMSTAMFMKASRHDSSVLWWGPAVALGGLGLVCLTVGIGEWLLSRNMTVFVDNETVGMTDMWGRVTAAPLTSLKLVQLSMRSVRVGIGQSIPVPLTQFVALDGTPLFEFRGEEVSVADLTRLCGAVGVPLVGSWPTR